MIKEIEEAANIIRDVGGLVISIGNGLSTAEGYDVYKDNEIFRTKFS